MRTQTFVILSIAVTSLPIGANAQSPLSQKAKILGTATLGTTALWWTANTPAGSGRTGHASAAVDLGGTNGTRIVVFGGDSQSGPVNTVEAFDPSSNAWTTLPVTRTLSGYTALSVGGADVMLFGCNGTAGEILAFNYNSSSFAVVAPMAVARKKPGVAFAGGKTYIFGGEDPSGTPLTSIEVFDNGTSATIPLQLPFTCYDAVALPNGQVFLHGIDPSGAYVWSRFTPNGAASTLTGPQAANTGLTNFTYKAGLCGATLIVVNESGQASGSGVKTFSVNLNTNTFNPIANPLGMGRDGFALATSKVGLFMTCGYRKFGGDTKYCDQLKVTVSKLLPSRKGF